MFRRWAYSIVEATPKTLRVRAVRVQFQLRQSVQCRFVLGVGLDLHDPAVGALNEKAHFAGHRVVVQRSRSLLLAGRNRARSFDFLITKRSGHARFPYRELTISDALELIDNLAFLLPLTDRVEFLRGVSFPVPDLDAPAKRRKGAGWNTDLTAAYGDEAHAAWLIKSAVRRRLGIAYSSPPAGAQSSLIAHAILKPAEFNGVRALKIGMLDVRSKLTRSHAVFPILAAATAVARLNGYECLYGTTKIANARLLRFYAGLGFESVGQKGDEAILVRPVDLGLAMPSVDRRAMKNDALVLSSGSTFVNDLVAF